MVHGLINQFKRMDPDPDKEQFAKDTGIYTWFICHEKKSLYLPQYFIDYLGYGSIECMSENALIDRDEMMNLGETIMNTVDSKPFVGTLHLRFQNNKRETVELYYLGESYTLPYGRKTMGVLVDVERKIQIEARLRHVDKLMLVGQMFGGVAHDIKNQIMTIDASVTMIDRYCTDDRIIKYLRSIEEAVENSTFLLQHLTKFAGNNRHDLRIMNVNELVARTVAILRQTVKGEFEFKANYNAKHDTILGEEHLLDNVLLNIALNARDAMPEGGAIEFTTYNKEHNPRSQKEHNGWIFISIKDNGIGMDKATKKRIFEPYFSTKPVGSGAGMGLALCLSTVHSHEGTIDVISEVGEGTEFILGFPLSMHESRVMVEKHEQNKGQVLVLDTDPSVRLILRSVLKELGYKVKAFSMQDSMCQFISEGTELPKAALINVNLEDVICPNILDAQNGCKGIKVIAMGENEKMQEQLNVKESHDREKLLKIVSELLEA